MKKKISITCNTFLNTLKYTIWKTKNIAKLIILTGGMESGQVYKP